MHECVTVISLCVCVCVCERERKYSVTHACAMYHEVPRSHSKRSAEPRFQHRTENTWRSMLSVCDEMEMSKQMSCSTRPSFQRS